MLHAIKTGVYKQYNFSWLIKRPSKNALAARSKIGKIRKLLSQKSEIIKFPPALAGFSGVPAGIFRGTVMPAKKWYDFFIVYINQVPNLCLY
jgi:hypothetical protein